MNRAQLIMARFDIAEYRLCRGLNRVVGLSSGRWVFTTASRLGDGIAWYVLVGVLPLIYGRAALRPALVMAITGLIGLLIYKTLKGQLLRERPFIRHPGITLAMAGVLNPILAAVAMVLSSLSVIGNSRRLAKG